MKTLLAFALAVVFLAGCTGQPGEIEIAESNNGQTIDATRNQTININLDSNATTGYKWNLVTEPDAKIVKLVSSKYNAPLTNLPGAGGSETWQFQATGAGTTTLKLVYFRQFEANLPRGKEFAITIVVK
ncbi:MAG: protease inhibitor I42 family protein [Chloroflexi bacterium]|nr:protease inhibitor I42 family protein [Chloroflexota bacterium]